MNRIKEIRQTKGIMQKDLAEAAQISAPYLHDLELNARGAKPETLERIAKALNVNVSDLMTED